MCCGIIKKSSKEKFLEIIKKLQENGAQGVVLGCTEIGLLIEQKDVAIKVFDTTNILDPVHIDIGFFVNFLFESCIPLLQFLVRKSGCHCSPSFCLPLSRCAPHDYCHLRITPQRNRIGFKNRKNIEICLQLLEVHTLRQQKTGGKRL